MAITSLARYATCATASLASMVLNLRFMKSPLGPDNRGDPAIELRMQQEEGDCRDVGSQDGEIGITLSRKGLGNLEVTASIPNIALFAMFRVGGDSDGSYQAWV